jgi:hypothetical protein
LATIGGFRAEPSSHEPVSTGFFAAMRHNQDMVAGFRPNNDFKEFGKAYIAFKVAQGLACCTSVIAHFARMQKYLVELQKP